MNAEEIRQIVLEELGNVAPETDPAALDPDADLREAHDLDSMDFLNLLEALHKRLGYAVPEVDYNELRTVRRAIDYLQAKTGG